MILCDLLITHRNMHSLCCLSVPTQHQYDSLQIVLWQINIMVTLLVMAFADITLALPVLTD